MALSADLSRTHAIFDLLKQTTTQQVIGVFLKSKGVPTSGTWDQLLDKRILPAVKDNLITNEELVELLRAAEECGRQHVFLYTCKAPTAVMDRARVLKVLKSKKLEQLLTAPLILDQPDHPSIADVRWHSANADLSFTVKEIERREAQYFKDEDRDSESSIITRTYEIRKERAVNIARLDRSGLLELRISARSTGSTKYADDLKLFWHRIAPFFPPAEFSPVSLNRAKQRLVNDKAALKAKIRFSNSKLKNDNGTTMWAASGEEADDLYDDAGAGNGLAAFLATDGGYCEGSNFHFRQTTGLSRDVHVIMSGEPNEFAITAGCGAEDYEYVLGEIKTLNKRIP